MTLNLVKERILYSCILLIAISSLCARQSSSYPIETLLALQNRTVPSAADVFQGGAIRTEEDLPRYKRAAKNLPTTPEGLSRLLREGTEKDGLISKAQSITACLIRTNQGRRVAILNGYLPLELFTQVTVTNVTPPEIPEFENLSTGIIVEGKTNGTDFSIVNLNAEYPLDSLKVQGVAPDRTGVMKIDESRTTDMAFAKDLRELCNQPDANEVAVIAEKEANTTISNQPPLEKLGVDNPYGRLPDHANAVRVRYDTYELVLQAIAVALLLLDLFILDDFQHRKIKLYHWAGVLLLAVATVVTVVMGYLQVLEVLKDEGLAWSSCASYNLRGFQSANSPFFVVRYNVLCEWVVIRATSTGASYLVLLPSAFGALLLLIVVIRFAVIRYRHHIAPPEELDEEEKLVREREQEAGHERHAKSPFFKRILPHFAVSKALMFLVGLCAMTCTAHAQQFPPSELKRRGPNLVGNDEILFLGGVATTSPFRCAWESRTGPTDDSMSEGTSLDGTADDCFIRWAPPKEDESTGLLFGQGKILAARCNKGVRCPFTGNVCPSDFGNFKCRTSFRDPGPINFLPEWRVKMVDRICRFGSTTSKTLCKLRMVRWLAKEELRMLTSQIQTKLNDERVNIHRISEYVFPDCAAPPKNISGFAFGKGTGSKHFSVTGVDCKNSHILARVARENARKACKEGLDDLNVCPQSRSHRGKRRSRRGRYPYRLGRWRRKGSSYNCRKDLEHLCVDALYTQLVIKSRNMRASDDWLIARCHQGGKTLFGGFRGNWKTNDDSIVGSDGDLPKDGLKNPLIRPVRQGWKFATFNFPRF